MTTNTTSDANGAADFDFDLVPPAQIWMFSNGRVTPEQLASAHRVQEHAIESQARVWRDPEPPAGTARRA